MRFESVKDLARLPYFTVRNGALALKPGIMDEGIIDFHAHLGWHYLLTRKIDLWKEREGTHFFPPTIPLHLEHYSGDDFTPEAKAVCRREVVRGAFDIHGYSATHTIPAILREMDLLNIGKSVLLAIDYPVLSHNTGEWLAAVNAKRESRVRLPVFMSLHPLMGNMERVLRAFIARGACGIKIHTQMQLFRANGTGAMKIYRLAEKYRLPVLFHTGLSPLSPSWQKRFVNMEDIEEAVRAYPGVRFVLGHAGGIDGYEGAMRLSRTYGNVYLEISGQPPLVIAEMVRKTDVKRILYGSDWAFYPMVLPLAKALLGTEPHKKVRKLIFRENARALLRSGN